MIKNYGEIKKKFKHPAFSYTGIGVIILFVIMITVFKAL
jgi:hypothetical protein